MYEWAAVLLAGAVGGLANALVAREITGITPYTTHKGRRAYDPGTVGTVLVGMLAGGAIWGLNHPVDNLAAPAVDIGPIVSVFFAGFGGGRVIEAAFERSFQDSALSDAADAILEATETSHTAAAPQSQKSHTPAAPQSQGQRRSQKRRHR